MKKIIMYVEYIFFNCAKIKEMGGFYGFTKLFDTCSKRNDEICSD